MVETYPLYMLFELKFSGKMSEKSMQQILTLIRQSRLFKISAITFKKMSKAQRFNFTYPAYGKRS